MGGRGELGRGLRRTSNPEPLQQLPVSAPGQLGLPLSKAGSTRLVAQSRTLCLRSAPVSLAPEAALPLAQSARGPELPGVHDKAASLHEPSHSRRHDDFRTRQREILLPSATQPVKPVGRARTESLSTKTRQSLLAEFWAREKKEEIGPP